MKDLRNQCCKGQRTKMVGIQYDISTAITGRPISEAKAYLEHSGFKKGEKKDITWHDEPQEILIEREAQIDDRLLDDFTNIEYCYSFNGTIFTERLAPKPLGTDIEGASVFMLSSLDKFVKISIDHLGLAEDYIADDEGEGKLKKKQKVIRGKSGVEFTYEEYRIEHMFISFLIIIWESFNKKTFRRTSLKSEELVQVNNDKYSYRVVKQDEREQLGKLCGTTDLTAPVILRNTKSNNYKEALCPYCCVTKPNYIAFTEGSNRAYLNHLLMYHCILGEEVIKPELPEVVMRNLTNRYKGKSTNEKLVCWLVCPYQSCKGQHYCFAAELDYSENLADVSSQIDRDTFLLEYHNHYLKCHYPPNCGGDGW